MNGKYKVWVEYEFKNFKNKTLMFGYLAQDKSSGYPCLSDGYSQEAVIYTFDRLTEAWDMLKDSNDYLSRVVTIYKADIVLTVEETVMSLTEDDLR